MEMEQRRPPEGLETTLEQSRAAAMKLARSSDGKKLMELLQAQGDQVRRAAQEAARGDPGPRDGAGADGRAGTPVPGYLPVLW